MRRTIVFIFSFLIFLVGVEVSRAFAAEFPQYAIKASIDVQSKQITASETVTFTNPVQEDLKEVYFHIYPNRKFSAKEIAFMKRYAGYFKVDPFPSGFQPPEMKFSSVEVNSKNASYNIEGEDETLLKITLPEAMKPGESVKILLNFNLKIPHAYGRFGWNQNIIALSRWYPILSVMNEKGWNNHPFYPFHRPFFSEAAQYDLELTIDQNQTVIHSGVLQGEANLSDGKKKLSIKTRQPVREMTLALSPDYRMEEIDMNGTKIKSYYLFGDEFHGREALNAAKDLMASYTRQFGPYPYSEFSIAPVCLGYGGEQMGNMIFIDTRVYKLPKRILSRYFDFLISHETGHQWFFNVLGIDEFSQMWLEEGVNSYFVLKHLEDKYGPDAEVVELPKILKWLLPNMTFRRTRDYRYQLLSRTNLNFPVVSKLSSYQEPSSIFSLAYGKGTRVVEMLHDLLGESVFNRVFARVFKDYQFKNFSIADLQKICQEESGQDLQWFFDEWLYSAKVCDLGIKSVKNQKIIVENKKDVAMPVQIQAHLADGTTESLTWDGKERVKEFSLEGQSRIQRVFLDPRQEILDIDKTNNNFPRKLFLKSVPLYLGLYDMPLFLPEDSYNLVVGPELAGNGFGMKASLQKPYDWNFYSATDYEFKEQLQHSRFGYQLNNVFHKQATAGVEIFNTTDYEDGAEDLAGGKVYYRRELWPAAYSLTSMNDHVTVYLLRDRSLNQDIVNREGTRNVSYLKKDEAITGAALHFERATPFWDPSQGFRVDTLVENSGHFLGATQYFYRGVLDASFYKGVTLKSKVALRFKHGWGFPTDKNLYELGGWDGLRGYDRKDVRGARTALGSLEYRFPLLDNLDLRLFDNFIGFESVGGVIFGDVGQSWYQNWDDVKLRKDAGLGLRFTVNLGSFLEKVTLRFDAARAINDSEEDDTHFWFGVNQAF